MNIFISYQRDDSPDASGRLKALVGPDARVQRVFFDRTSIPAGRIWPEVIANEIGTAHVLLAVIGPRFDVRFVATLVNDARLPAKGPSPTNCLGWLTGRRSRSTRARSTGRS